MVDMVENLAAMLAAGQDTPLLRFTLGSQLLSRGEHAAALVHLQAAVRQDPSYSAAWKILGKALQASGDAAGARHAFIAGIAAAGQKGDIQAAREMKVYLKRVEKALEDSG